MSANRVEDVARLWPRFGVPDGTGPLDPPALFGRSAPLVVEVGAGTGEATVAMAAADPGRDYLAVEVYTAGVANLLRLLAAAGPGNVRVFHGDAVRLLQDRLPAASLDAVHLFFPDPWPKARHQKRRFLQPARVRLLVQRLAPGAVLHCATDSASYAAEMLELLTGAPELANVHTGFAPRPAHRPETRYERRGLLAGRPAYDLMFRRVVDAP
jgi:tRNA (guanine-N7-)-methyltransferase